MDNLIRLPVLASCATNSKPKTNQKAGQPEDWFSPSKLEGKNLRGYTFDFFVNWNTMQFGNEIWVKGVLKNNISYKELKNNIVNSIEEVWTSQYIKSLVDFFIPLGCDLFLILFYDKQDWNDASTLYKVEAIKTKIN